MDTGLVSKTRKRPIVKVQLNGTFRVPPERELHVSIFILKTSAMKIKVYTETGTLFDEQVDDAQGPDDKQAKDLDGLGLKEIQSLTFEFKDGVLMKDTRDLDNINPEFLTGMSVKVK